MIFFVTVLRALAACIITNAHYTGVYPTDLIANGGLLGDVMFFAVSGFCFAKVKEPFPKWYFKRLVRILPVVWLITAIYGIVGLFEIEFTFKVVLLLLLAALFRCFASVDARLENLPKPIKTVITFISTITLEIYLVQISLIQKLNFLPFPANWALITAAIILFAFLLNKLTNPVYTAFKKAIDKPKK